MSSERRIAVGRGKTSRVRPVRSPSMCMSTAAIGSSGSLICVGTSSSDAMLMVGTLIMIVLPVICESAVAACPAPMFATSRSASSWTSFNAVMSFIPCPLQKAPYVHDQRGGAVAQNRRAAEKRRRVTNRVELLHHDVLLASELVYDQTRAPLANLEHDHLRHARPVARETEERAKAYERQHVIAEHQHLVPLHRFERRRFEL